MGAGAGGRDRRGDRAGGRAAADRRQERGLHARAGELLQPPHVRRGQRAEGRAAPGAPAGHARAGPPGRVPRAHAPDRLRPAGVARAREPGQGQGA